MKFLVNTNLGRKFTNLLKQAGYDATFTKDIMPAATDEDILYFAEKENMILITEDRDFCELIFKFNLPARGVIFFRATTNDPEKRFEMIKNIIDKAEDNFIVVREGKVRIREL